MRALLLSFLVLAACGSSDDNQQSWSVVGENQPAALLSVWGSSAADIYVVGGDRKDGTGPIVDHFDGTSWTALNTGVQGVDLWWVFGFANGPVFMSGSDGTILEYQNGTFTKLPTPGNLIVFGLWGASPTDMWAVGGQASGGGFAWHYDGTTWTPNTQVPPAISGQGTIWKVGGRASNDIWMGCTGGTMLHWDGTTLSSENLGVDGSLLSVAGSSKRFITVGEANGGVIFENDGGGWKSAYQTTNGSFLTGVAVSESDAYAVGQFGTVVHRTDSWSPEKGVTTQNLHGAFIDSAGGVWAAGGQFDSNPMTAGVLIHSGDPVPALP
ncbi:MAG TPA: hypothetical protein VGC41_26960 [Kofleriaceae bacterium]